MSEFNNELENQTQDVNPVPAQQGAEQVPSPKKKKKWYIPVALLIIAVAVVFAFFYPTLANAFAKLTLSPAEYYQKIESSNQDKQIDKLSKSYGEYLDSYEKYMKDGIGTKANITANIDSSIVSQFGLAGLESVSISTDSMIKDYKTKSDLGLLLNGENIANISMLMDMGKQEAFYLIPGLNEAYLKMSYSDLYEGELASANPMNLYRILDEQTLSEKQLNQLLKKYINLVIKELDQVTETKNDKVTADGITQSYTKLSVKIDDKKAFEISKSVLTKASSDKELEDLLIKMNLLTSEEYHSKIKSGLEEIEYNLKNISTTEDNNTVIMSIWIDNKGNIMGRELVSEATDAPFQMGYQKAIDGTKMGIRVWASQDKKEFLSATGTVSLKASGISGDIHMNLNQEGTSPLQLTVNIKDANYKYKDGYTSINGDFTFTSENDPAIKVNVKATGKDKQQSMVVDVIQGTVTMVSVTLDSSVTAYTSIEMPVSSAKTYDMITEIDQYIESSDLTGYLEGINEKIKIEPINALLNNYIQYSAYY